MKKTLTLIAILSFILTGCSCSTKDKNYNETEITDQNTLLTTYLDKPSAGRPKSQEPINNIFIALNILKEATYYESNASGEIIAKKGSLKLATQNLETRRTITPSATFNESVSVSTFVKIAEQLYITDNEVLKRDASKVSSSDVSWKNSVTKLSTSKYLEQYGYSAKEPSRYIINEESIISDIEITNNGIGRKFTYKFKLDPTISTYYYKTGVKSLSNSSSYPKFKSIEMEMTFDYKWRMTKIKVDEVYDITISGLGSVTCHANIIETFKNINKVVSINEESFFKSKL